MKKLTVLFFLCTMIICGLWTNQAEASIVLKTTVVNPSTTKTQTALLKAYLPKETSPEDIVDLGDLKIDYDISRGLYYVYKECELAPGESIMRSVELKDVWVISRAEIDALTGEAKRIVEKLKKTVYFDMATVLQKDIEAKGGEILTRQDKVANALPQTHIAVYRENIKALNAVKTSLARLDDMLLKTKLASAESLPRKKISVKATWWMILAVIISLGLLSVVFFIIWHRQATGISEVKEEKKKEEEMPPPESGKE